MRLNLFQFVTGNFPWVFGATKMDEMQKNEAVKQDKT